MRLLLVKTGSDLLIGYDSDRLSQPAVSAIMSVINPMRVELIQQVIPAKINGASPQIVKGFNLVPLPCGEIFMASVEWHGYVTDAAMTQTYEKVLAAVKKGRADELKFQ